jgi:hypothetical protein
MFKQKKLNFKGGDNMEWLNTVVLLVIAIELFLIYLRLGDTEKK